MTRAHAVLAVAVVLLWSSGSLAQTNDHVFRSWRSSDETQAPRALGLAGALVAVDDTAAVRANPAAPSDLAKTEVVAAAQWQRAGVSALGDPLLARASLGFAGVTTQVGARGRLVAYAAETQGTRFRLQPTALPDGLTDTGSLEASVSELGLSASLRLPGGLSVGGRVAAARLSLDGSYSRDPAAGPTDLRVESRGSSTRPATSWGASWKPASWIRVGVSSRNGVGWRLERKATSPVMGTVLDPGSPYEVRRPAVLSLGFALQPSLKLLVAAQGDYVRYDEVQSALVIGQGAHSRSAYEHKDGWEGRLGAELSLPRRQASLQLRAGVHWRAPGGPRFTGLDETERATFPGSSRSLRGTTGLSIVTPRWLRLDVAASFAGEQTQVMAGLAARF